MKASAEKQNKDELTVDMRRQWVAPVLTVINVGVTAGGPTMDTLEASTYYQS